MIDSPVRKRQMDGLRCLAFLSVFAEHIPNGWHFGGPVGVYTFFALSGFLITRILLADTDASVSRKLGRFYARRVLRIFPLYYLTLAWLWMLASLPNAAWYFLYSSNILAYLNHGFDNAVGHFWTLAAEEWFYIFYPPILLLAKPRVRLLVGLLVLSKISRGILAYISPPPWYAVLVSSCGEYLLWGGLAAVWERENRSLAWPSIAYIGLGTVLVAAYYSLRGVPATEAPWAQLVLDGTPDGIGFALIVLGLWRGEGAFGIKLLTLAPLVYLGRISYGLYVYHVLVLNGPIGMALHGFLDSENIRPWTPWLVDLPITVGMATFSWWLVEQPVLRLKERFAYHYE